MTLESSIEKVDLDIVHEERSSEKKNERNLRSMREYKSCFDITFVCKNVGKQGMSNLISCLIRRAREL